MNRFKTNMGYVVAENPPKLPQILKNELETMSETMSSQEIFDEIERRDEQALIEQGFERYFIAQCQRCEPILPLPFRDVDQRNKWAQDHSTVKAEDGNPHTVKIYTEWK